MVVTVFERLQVFSNATKFKFQTKHKAYIGIFVARKFRQMGGIMEMLQKVESGEPEASYEVYAYPAEFTIEIDLLIARFVDHLRAPRKPKETEKPLINNQSAHPISYSSDTSKNKVRKRKPIPATPQREFSGKKLINKNNS